MGTKVAADNCEEAMKIPEQNLNPPKDNFIECPDCGGRGWIGYVCILYRGAAATA